MKNCDFIAVPGIFNHILILCYSSLFISSTYSVVIDELGIPLMKMNVNEMECSGIKSIERGTKPSMATWSKNTQGFVRLPYFVHKSLGTNGRLALEQSTIYYARYTCILLEPKLDTDDDYVEFQDDETGCWSYLGRIGGKQEINLEQPGCLQTIGTTLHEIAHALGIDHEQSRPDRDQYVTIFLDNVITGSNGEDYTENFVKDISINSLGTAYDYSSMMHYPSTAFAKQGTYTILKSDNISIVNTQRNGFSEIDVEQLNLLYDCNAVNNAPVQPTSCYNTDDRGFSYRGTVNYGTVGGKVYICDNWADHVNVENYYLNGLNENFCRNPNVMYYDRPVCYKQIGEVLYYIVCSVGVCPSMQVTTKPVSTTHLQSVDATTGGCISTRLPVVLILMVEPLIIMSSWI